MLIQMRLAKKIMKKITKNQVWKVNPNLFGTFGF